MTKKTSRSRRHVRDRSSGRLDSPDQLGESLRKHLADTPSAFTSWHAREPRVLVGNAQPAPDPKSGIALYGPWRSAETAPLPRIRVAVVGTGQTIQQATSWLDMCQSTIAPTSAADPVLFPAFPGMASETGFGCALEYPNQLTETLSMGELARITEASTRDASVETAGEVIARHLQALTERDAPPDVVLIALPVSVRDKAGGGRRPPRKRPGGDAPQLQLNFMDPRPDEPFRGSRTLHRVVKAAGMRASLPTQLAWETTLTGKDVQDDATRAWNFCTGLYYKAGGVPWRVQGLALNTCYVGISFYRSIDAPEELQTSMAQAFSDRGEGTVLRGASFSWDKRSGPPCLPRDAARQLIADVLQSYSVHHSQPPARLVVHKSSRFSEDERRGMLEALDGVVPYHDFLSLAPSNIRFLRTGKEPPLRGTVIEVSSGRYVLFTRGYVPYLKVYPGLRIPHPMDVHHHGTSSIVDLTHEVLALTRMNYNSADFASADPITLGFARNVGLILSELPKDLVPKSSFRFYM